MFLTAIPKQGNGLKAKGDSGITGLVDNRQFPWLGQSTRRSCSCRGSQTRRHGAQARFQRSYNGVQPGNPYKAATVILQVATMTEPPLRLLLGNKEK